MVFFRQMTGQFLGQIGLNYRTLKQQPGRKYQGYNRAQNW